MKTGTDDGCPSPDIALEAFIAASTAQYAATLEGDHKASNEAHDRVARAADCLRRSAAGLRLLEGLVADHDEAVASKAALFVEDEKPEFAVPVFRRVARRKDLLGMMAKYALERWEAGGRFRGEPEKEG